jgi:hypothetical protein
MDQSLMKTTILLLVSDPVVRSILKETLGREGHVDGRGAAGVHSTRLS